MADDEAAVSGVVPDLVTSRELRPVSPTTPRMRSRWIYAPSPGGWSGVPMAEWELERAGFSDRHPHDEVNHVLDGELHVRIGGTEVVGGPGDTIRVPAGSTGHYSAPVYARMLAVYGPNPAGEDSENHGYVELDDRATATDQAF